MLDRLLQSSTAGTEIKRLRERMIIRSHFRRDVVARGKEPARSGRFGTVGMSGVSAFATPPTPSRAAEGSVEVGRRLAPFFGGKLARADDVSN